MANGAVDAIVQALAEVLGTITVANGYHTDLGANVQTEIRGVEVPAEPQATVWAASKQRTQSGQARPDTGRGVEGYIEFAVPARYDDAMARVYAADEDLDRCLSQMHLMPNALPVQYEDAVFMNRPEGLAVAMVQVRWTTGFRRQDATPSVPRPGDYP